MPSLDTPYIIEKLFQKFIKKKKLSFNGTDAEFNIFVETKFTDCLNALAETYLEYCFDTNNDLKKQERKIVKKIKKKYSSSLEILDAFIELNSKISQLTYEKFHKQFNDFKDHLKLDILISLHVRAIQVANEVKVLVSNGYADGAHARWRTLHEICITFLFLYDSDYETIRMYNDYQVIENWKKAKEYKDNFERLRWKQLEDEVYNELEKDRNKLIKIYGKEFTESYGWTMKRLPRGKRNIREIEKLVEKDYLRFIYAWSSENVHSGILGIKTRLGLRKDESTSLLTGPSDYGFLDPVQFTSYSLTEMSVVLLRMEQSIMHELLEELVYLLQNEIVKSFSKP